MYLSYIRNIFFDCLFVYVVVIMFDRILRKAWFEVELLVLVGVFSLCASSLLIADAGLALGMEKHSLALIVLRMLELIFGVMWLFLSLRMTLEINRFRRKYFSIFFLLKRGRLEEEQKRSEAAELVRDMVAFYRGYYRRVLAVLGLAITVGFLIVVAAVYLLLYGYMSFWEAIFRWTLSSLMLLSASALYVYVHRGWGRRLLRVKDAEEKLSELLGGPIEA